LVDAVDDIPECVEHDTAGATSPVEEPDSEDAVSVKQSGDAEEHPDDVPVSGGETDALLDGPQTSLKDADDEQAEADAPATLRHIDTILVSSPHYTQVSLDPLEQPEVGAGDILESVEHTEAVEQFMFTVHEGSVADVAAVDDSNAVVPPSDLSKEGEEEEEKDVKCPKEVGLLVSDVVHKVTPPSTSPHHNPRHTASSSSYTDDNLRHLYERMLETKRSPDPDAIPPLRRWVAREMRAAAFDGRYDQGAQLETAELMLEDFVTTNESGYLREQRRLHAARRLADWRARYEKTVQVYADKIAGWRQSQSERGIELAELHRRQVENFEHQWADPNFLLQFNKPSPRALSLRQIEQNLAFAKQFNQAKLIKIEADRLEKQEAIFARKRAIMVMKQEFIVLEAKQQKEVECLHEFTKRTLIVMEQARDGALASMNLVIQRLAGIANPETERAKRKSALYQPQGSPRMPRPMRNVHSGRALKPRTLGLAGIQVKQFIKVKKVYGGSKNESRMETV
jgi:hypothetical protein